ncbi:hypothetical protein RHRU231_30024 [Rhodococcus ruber]|uniref:Uncharacterized protein n=1 Tax=Rhodococcus ruber TaxID=1830 RepID=A0A098BIF5_9NOCA|nr:hypothetical protein RHRU231_30024 [Rhodococcus ruber]
MVCVLLMKLLKATCELRRHTNLLLAVALKLADEQRVAGSHCKQVRDVLADRFDPSSSATLLESFVDFIRDAGDHAGTGTLASHSHCRSPSTNLCQHGRSARAEAMP